MQLIKKIYKLISICAFFIFLLIQSAYSGDKMEKASFIISTGNELREILFQNGELKANKSILISKKFDSAVWPAYDKKNGLIYFEAQNEEFGWAHQIFSMNFFDKDQNYKKVTEGRRPAISQNGSLLAYYRHPNQLWLLEIESNTEKKIVLDISDNTPIVWISNLDFLYTDIDQNMIKMNVLSGKGVMTGHRYIIPGALSPDKKQILCGSYDGKKIFLYTISTNEIDVLKKSIFFSMGSSFVWSYDGESFLYTRQILLNQIKLIESQSLFLCMMSGKEIKLIDRFSLFGGFALVY